MNLFFDPRDVVHCEFPTPDQTVNTEFYLSVMRSLLEAIFYYEC